MVNLVNYARSLSSHMSGDEALINKKQNNPCVDDLCTPHQKMKTKMATLAPKPVLTETGTNHGDRVEQLQQQHGASAKLDTSPTFPETKPTVVAETEDDDERWLLMADALRFPANTGVRKDRPRLRAQSGWGRPNGIR